jgi:nucleoredoxin
MSKYEQLFGEKLVRKDGSEVAAKDLDGKAAVLVYFSAHWCGPCRGFTPTLSKTYEKLKEDKKDVECVFVSSDHNDEDFNTYFGSMPDWLALGFADRDRKTKLSQKFKVRGIPTLVILDGNAEVITVDGRAKVTSDPEGLNFPWVPPTFDEAFGTDFVNSKLEAVKRDEFKGKVVALYFSAHWCPPCKKFTPQFAKVYKKLKIEKKDFEVVFVSSDRDEESFNDYMGEMPWIAVPYADSKRRRELSERFEVEGIPALVIVDAEGKVINKNARGDVSADLAGAKFPWAPEPVNELTGAKAASLNECAGVMAFLDADADEKLQDQVHEAMLAAHAEVGKDSELNFFLAKQDPVVKQVKHLMEMGPDGSSKDTVLAILDVTQAASFHSTCKNANDITKDLVATFIKDFKRSQIAKTPLHTH